MKHRVGLLFLAISSGLVGASTTVVKELIDSHGTQFELRWHPLCRWYTSTHGIFFARQSTDTKSAQPENKQSFLSSLSRSFLPKLVSLKTKQGMPVSETARLSPKGSFWYAPIVNAYSTCVWVDKVGKEEYELKGEGDKERLRSFILPEGFDPDADIFWSSDDSTLAIFDRCGASIDLYLMNQKCTPVYSIDVQDAAFIAECAYYNAHVKALAYDPIAGCLAVICNPRSCTATDTCGSSDCVPGHAKKATLHRLLVPPKNKFLQELSQNTIPYGDHPLLQYNEDGTCLLYTFDIVEKGTQNRIGYILATTEQQSPLLGTCQADQLCFSEDGLTVLLYSGVPSDPAAGHFSALNYRTHSYIHDVIVPDFSSGVLHTKGLIGYRQGRVERLEIAYAEAADKDKSKGGAQV